MIFKKIQWLSLDIVLGGAIFFVFVSKQFNIIVSFASIMAFAAAMLSIYLIDHLSDASKIENTKNERRLFFIIHRKKIKYFLLFSIISGVASVCFISLAEAYFGIALGLIIVFYLFLHIKIGSKGLKEPIIAFAFSSAIFSQAFLFSILDSQLLLTFFQLALICQVNLMAISVYDYEDDSIEGFSSIATLWGRKKVTAVAFGLISLTLLVALYLFTVSFLRELQVFYTLSALVMMLILMFKDFFRRNQRYRIFADGIFYLPLFFKSFWI